MPTEKSAAVLIKDKIIKLKRLAACFSLALKRGKKLATVNLKL